MTKNLIDKTDLKILSLLEENGRATHKHMAKLLGISAITAATRMDALIKNKILSIHAIPNPIKMGQVARAVICMNISKDKLDSLCEQLRMNLNINLVVLTFGRFNLLIIAYFPSWDLLHKFLSTDIADRRNISELEIFFIEEVKKRHHEIKKSNTEHQKVADIDDINRRIIEELSLDGRATCNYLANKLGISLSSASKRLNRLIKQSVIKIQAIIDSSKIGYQTNAFIFMRADNDKIDKICKELLQDQRIFTIMTLANGYDIFLSVITKNTEAAYELINNISSFPGVFMIETLIRGRIVKRYYGDVHVGSDVNSGHQTSFHDAINPA
jgi:DNA-binding Lrp family transcriptional regulator